MENQIDFLIQCIKQYKFYLKNATFIFLQTYDNRIKTQNNIIKPLILMILMILNKY